LKLAYSENEATGCIDLPKFIKVTCPAISGARHIVEVELELQIIKPKEGERIKFSLVPYGKNATQLVQEACLCIAETEFIAPATKAIEVFTSPIPALYIRSKCAPAIYDATNEIKQMQIANQD